MARRVTVARPRLSHLLDSLTERRLTVVLGDAASGKSLAVTDWIATRDDPVVLVTPSVDADGPRGLLDTFAAATAGQCPGLRDALEPELSATATTTADDPAALAAVLAGALAAGWAEHAAGPFTVVLDAFERIADPAGADFVAALVRLYPRSVRMVVLSRVRPDFAVERLSAAGAYSELAPRALRFEPDETRALFAANGLDLDADEAAALTDACGGWAAGLRLALEAALTEGTSGLVERLARSDAPALLAAVALTPLDDASRRTVRAMAVIGHIERAVTTLRPDVTDRLDRLAERGLLVAADESGWTLTALARHAVQTRQPPDPALVRDVLCECVDMAIATDAYESGLRWAARLGDQDAGDGEVVRTAIAALGDAAFDAGSDALAEAAAHLPVPVGDLAIDGLLAAYFALRGDVTRALDHLGTGDGALPVATAWRVASALWMHGDAQGARAMAARADGGTGSEVGAADEAQLAAVLATLSWARGDGPQARAHADAALARAREAGSDSALGTAWVVQALAAALEGDLNRNQRCYATALVHAAAAHDVLTQLRVHCNLGSHLIETGRCREALAELELAVRLGEATGQRTRTALARLNLGQARLGLGLLDEGLADADAALDMWLQLDSPMAAYAQQLRGDLLARRGDVSRAAGAYRSAVAEAELQSDAQTLVPALAGLARCLVADDPDGASALAQRAVAEPAALGTLPALLALGWVQRVSGDAAAAAATARTARDEAVRRDSPGELASALLLEVLSAPEPDATDSRLVEARAVIDEVGDVIARAELDVVAAALDRDRSAQDRAAAQLRALGVRDSATMIAGPLAVVGAARAATVELRTLGGFGVRLGGVAVPSSAWQSRKARDLVKILAARRGRPITRDALAELLWPDTADASGNRLSVALSTARSVFDPDKQYAADHVIVADRSAVRLELHTVALDLDTYFVASQHALDASARDDVAAVALLTAAAAAYGGDFCEEDVYEEWAVGPRDDARARQQHVVHALAERLLADDRPDDAVPWWIALVGLDEFDERAHLGLITTLVKAGRHGQARRGYRTYLERMSELGVEPAAFPQRPRSGAVATDRFPEGPRRTVRP